MFRLLLVPLFGVTTLTAAAGNQDPGAGQDAVVLAELQQALAKAGAAESAAARCRRAPAPLRDTTPVVCQSSSWTSLGYGVESMNWLPSGSLNNANVPHGCFWGGETKSTPRATSS